VVVYFDDILIYSKSIDEHINHLCVVFNTLRDTHLFGNLEKCTFCTDRVSFFGYVVTPQGIEVDHAKLAYPKKHLIGAKFFRPCGVLLPFCEGFLHHCCTVE
jgi:hypothetical protein